MGHKAVLGVSGSVAAYRAADIAREMMRRGFTVRVCLTDAAEQFVTRALFEALTGQPCVAGAFEEPERGRMAHIDWARWADLLVVAPATANTLSNLAHGSAVDMLTTISVAYDGPLLIAPAMNPTMYASDSVGESIRMLNERGAVFVEPEEGDVACGENGQGKLATATRIAERASVMVQFAKKLEGKRVLITSGPTQEPIDDVRFLTNRSSGRMGAALAQGALLMGADVTVVTGPVSVPLPLKARVIRVRTADEMLREALAQAPSCDLIIGAAAVSDYRTATPFAGKLRRDSDRMSIELVKNPDIIASLAAAAPNATVVGFAAEPTSDAEYAKDKLARKGLAAIAINDISRTDAGFESATNQLTLIFADGRVEKSETFSKLECAKWLLELVAP